jgi:HSP20 family protein
VPTSSRSNLFEEIEQIFERTSQQFDERAESWGDDGPLARVADPEGMAVDLVEHGDEFLVTVDVPGFDKDDVDVRPTDDTLRVEAEHGEFVDEGGERSLRRERRHESMRRSIRLPEEVESETTNACVRQVREPGAEHVVLPVPVAPLDTVERLADDVDEVVAVERPRRFSTVGQFYRSFDLVSDEAARSSLDCGV